MMHALANWFLTVTGSNNTSGTWYGFWSGFGSDLGEVALVGSLAALYHHHNCAVPRCPRIAHKKYEVPETKQYTCHKHHTQYWHDLLVAQFKQDYPEQHKLINKNVRPGKK
jgi:hypothetical protein